MRYALSTAVVAAMLLGVSAGAGHATSTGEVSGPLVDGQNAPAAAPQGEDAGTKGRVTLRCTVGADRSLGHCVVTSEMPPGHGLGEAALRMAQQIRIRPETFAPEMVGQSIEIPIGFARDADDQDDMPSGVAAMPSP